MVIQKVLIDLDLSELTNEILEVLGYRCVPTEFLPPLKPILDFICSLSEGPVDQSHPRIAFPHWKLRNTVLYRDVSVFSAMDVLLHTHSVPTWDNLILTSSPGLETEPDVLLLWSLSPEEAASLLAEGNAVPKPLPLQELTLDQFRSIELVEGTLHNAAVLLSKYLLAQGLIEENLLEFEATKHLASLQNRELGYPDIILEEPFQALYTSWARYQKLRSWQLRTAKAILHHYRKG